MKQLIALGLAALTSLSSMAQADVPVVEESQNYIVLADNSQPSFTDRPTQATRRHDEPLMQTSSRAPGDSRLSLLLSKIESIQEELQQLRGQLEMQQHQMKQMHKQQLAFNKDLDNRLATEMHAKIEVSDEDNEGLVPAAIKPVSSVFQATERVANKRIKPLVAETSVTDVADQQLSYVAAFELIKNKDFSRAELAMQAFVRRFPRSSYTPNAHYWLGELLLKKKKNRQAINAFKTVLEQFPDSNKVAACAYKLGVAYARSGNIDKAKEQLLAVQARFPDTSTARLATSQLRRLSRLS